ncbi:MAG: transposase [Halobacteriales archaeon]
MSTQALPSVETVEDVFNLLETEVTLLEGHLDPTFLEQFEVFAPDPRGRTPEFDPFGLFLAHLYCYHNDIYGQRAVSRALQDETIWRQCGFPRAPSRDPIKRFRCNFSDVAEAVFGYLVEQAARRGLLSPTYRIDSTDVRAVPRDDSDGQWNHDPTADEKYFGYGCTLVTTANNVPVAAAFTDGKQVDEETARRVTEDALAVKKPLWMIGDSAFDILAWHDDLLLQNVVPVAPYNQRNANDPLDIEYRVEDRVTNHYDNICVSRSQLEETYKKRSQVENTINVCKEGGLGRTRARDRTMAKAHVFLSLCLRLVVAITNHERGGDPSSPNLAL